MFNLPHGWLSKTEMTDVVKEPHQVKLEFVFWLQNDGNFEELPFKSMERCFSVYFF